MNVLVTGGAGYIGSHGAKRLLAEGRHVVIVDDLSRGWMEAVEAAASTAGGGRLAFERGDVGDRAAMERVIRKHGIEAVMHFAGLAYVGESVERPLLYHRTNTAAAIELLAACDAAGVERFVFSSTCAVYGQPPKDRLPIREDAPIAPVNPYGRSKAAFEHVLMDHAAAMRAAGRPFGCAILRYFNVAGCDGDGLLGEHRTPESRIMSIAIKAALGVAGPVVIHGEDYETPDGTCVRDFVHVDDLVDGHVRALGALDPASGAARVFNLGNGRPASVRQVIAACERASGRTIPIRAGARRAGDVATLYADATRARNELGWRPRIESLDDIAASAWAWHASHPGGYAR